MESTKSLRKWVNEHFDSACWSATNAALNNRIDAIEEEFRRQRDTLWNEGYDIGFASADKLIADYKDELAEHGYIKLPVDADGVPIHIGDVMDGTCPSGKHVNGTVNAIGDGVFWLSNVQFSLKPDYMHHYHAPTVEDVLREFADTMSETHPLDVPARIAEYAAKLRLAGDE